MANAAKTLQITQIHVKNFRCFDQKILDFDNPVVVIEGSNGVGKTSLLEALYYGCYLRSFRTHLPRELIRFGQDSFFIKIEVNNQALLHEIKVGFSGSRRLVKVDQKAISSYKELMDHYRIVSIAEDDLILIKSGPQIRRSFIDQAILLHDPEFITTIRNFRQVVDNRNRMLYSGSYTPQEYAIWTEQLWQKSREIQHIRQKMLHDLAQEVARIVKEFFNNSFSVTFEYMPKKMPPDQSIDDFLTASSSLGKQEHQLRRSLFGAHLDDFAIQFQDRGSKMFASRGQQKLIVFLLKIAQIKQLAIRRGPALFLLDDFMTDFDENYAQLLLSVLTSLDSQLIFTSPAKRGALEYQFAQIDAQYVKLTH